MAMLTQALRFAYEPFVFSKSKEKDSREMYAKAMKFFIIFTLLAFLAVMFYLDILRYILGRDYWVGLKVVPIVMAAEMFMGIYFNLSFWYKLIDETKWGAYFSGQKKYPINYDLKAIGNYVALALVLYIVSVYLPIQNIFLLLGVRTLLLLLFVAYIVKTDFPLQQIPVINRYIKK